MNKIRLKGWIGIILIVAMLALFFGWETVGRDALMYDEVLALNKEISKGEKVTENDVRKLKIEKDSMGRVAKNEKEIIGRVALVDVEPNIPISKNYFGEANITPDKDQFIFEVPSSWIYALPQSIRAGDTAYFYEVKEGEIVDGELVEENNIDEMSSEHMLESKIKYVKDGSNREITNITKDRSDGSGKVATIEIIASVENIAKLESMAEDGSKFIILYKE